MALPICEERSDLPTPKRQKIEANTCDDYDSDSDYDSPRKFGAKTYEDYDKCTPEEIQQFRDEMNKNQGFEIDFSKLTYWSCFRPVDLDASTWGCDSGDYETDRDFIAFLARAALTERNAEGGTSLELGKILMANWRLGGGIIFNICFEVNDPSESDGNQAKTIPFRAMVGYLGRDNLTTYSCGPKPSS